MNNDCNCTAMLGMIDATLESLSAIPRDTYHIGSPAVVAVENLLNRQRGQIESQHRRHTSNAKPVYVN